MFKQLFASMNEALSDMMAAYPAATQAQKAELDEKLRILRTMSDTFIEEWLLFEERLGHYMQMHQQPGTAYTNNDPELSGKKLEGFQKGQGYYKLHMYRQAVDEFELLVKQKPEFTLARIYLAMGYLRSGEPAEAYRHFYFLTQISDNTKMKAISYNAMGCIHMQKQNVEQACECFSQAYQSDPASIEPLIALGLCYEHQGTLQFIL